DRTGRLIDRSDRERDVERVVATDAREHERGLGRGELGCDALQLRRIDAGVGSRLLHAALSGQRVGDGQLAARLARDPLVGIEAGERTTRANVDEARSAIELGPSVGEVELLWDAGAPALEEVSADRNDELRVLEAVRGPRHAVRAAIGFDGRRV